jgi:hypothetical protein
MVNDLRGKTPNSRNLNNGGKERTSFGFFSIIVLYGVSLRPPGYMECFRYTSCSSFLPETLIFRALVTTT